jgi:hypothetical protein
MKKVIIFGSIVILLGLLIALGPQFLFKVCDLSMSDSGYLEDCCAEPVETDCCGPAISSYPICHWTARAEIGIGLLVAALGACMIVFTDPKTHLGLIIGVFMASMIAFAIPNFLIGGCGMLTMKCRRVAFPALTAESVALLVFSAIMVTVIAMQKPPEKNAE